VNETAAAGDPGAAALPDTVPLRRNSRFRLLWIGQVLSDTGTEAALIACPLLILGRPGRSSWRSAAEPERVQGA